MAYDAVEYAKERGLIVELSGEDASRADPGFLLEVYRGGVERGADRLCFCDTVGLLTPERTAALIPPLCIAPLSIHCHNDLGFALANTVTALKAGASCAHVTVNGLGERAGNTPFEELVMATGDTLQLPDFDCDRRDLSPFYPGLKAYRCSASGEQSHRWRDGIYP